MTEQRRQYLLSEKKKIQEMIPRALNSLEVVAGQVRKLRDMEAEIDKELGSASAQPPAPVGAPHPSAANVICFPGKVRAASPINASA